MVTDMAATDKLQQALQIVHYLSPAVVILYYILALTISICTLHNLDSSRSRPRKILLRLTVVILLSYLVEVCLLVIDTLVNHGRLSSTDRNVSRVPT